MAADDVPIEAGPDLIAKVRRRLMNDAEFRYRVTMTSRVMAASYANNPSTPQVALVLAIDEQVRRANDIR